MSDCSLAVVGLEEGPNSAPRLSTLAARALTGGEAPRLRAGEAVCRPVGACALVLAALDGVLVLYEHGRCSGMDGILPRSEARSPSGGGHGVDGLADGKGGIPAWAAGFALSGESSRSSIGIGERSSIGSGSWPSPSQTGILSTG